MPVGIKIWNDSYGLQVDGQTMHMVFLRKATVTGTQIPNGLSSGFCQVDIPLNPGEMLAFNTPYGAAMAGRWTGNGCMQVHFQGLPGTTLSYWVYGPYQPSGLNFGLQIRSESNQLLYDTGRMPLRYVADIQGVGTFPSVTKYAGQQLALIAYQQYCRMDILNPAQNPNGSWQGMQQFTTGFGRINSDGTVTVQNIAYTVDPYGPAYPPSDFANGYWSNNINNGYAVIDVTHT